MNANTVHTIFLALPMEEQKRLYNLIGNDITKAETIRKPRRKKPQIISDLESRNYLLEKVFKVKLKNS